MTAGKKTEELDLLQLLLNAVNLIRTNFWLIIIFFLLGASIGFFHFSSAKKVYENKIVVNSNILTETYSKILLDDVNRHLDEADFALVAKQLNVSEDVAREIRTLKIEGLKPDAAPNATDSDRFRITAEVYDQKILDDLQKGLIFFLESNDYVRVRVEQNKTTTRQLLSNVQKEIADMEAFKVKLFNGEFFQSIRGNVMFDPTTVNSKILDLKEKELTYKNSLELSGSVFIISGFNRFLSQTRPQLLLSLVAGASIGLTFVCLFIAFKSVRKLLRLAEASK